MTFRKWALAGLTLMMVIVALPQTGVAQRVVVFRPYAAYGFGWGPAWYSPYYYPNYYPGPLIYATGPRHGDVKIETHLKDASVYVDGGFAGMTPKLKQFGLQPGNHDIEVRDSAGQTLFHDRVHVLEGKTVQIKL